MNKKGQGISMTYIIIALLALVVLVVIILFFTGGMQKLFGQTAEVGEVTEQQMSLWRTQCDLYCSVDKAAFCDHEFNTKDKEGTVTKRHVCNKAVYRGSETVEDLEVLCENIKDSGDCGQ